MYYLDNLFLCALLTPSHNQEDIEFLSNRCEDDHQQEVEHDPLTQHPTEGGQEEVMEESRHKCTATLQSCKEKGPVPSRGNSQPKLNHWLVFSSILSPNGIGRWKSTIAHMMAATGQL